MSISSYLIGVSLSCLACAITYALGKWGERDRCTWLVERTQRGLHNGSPHFLLGQLIDEIKSGNPTHSDTQLYEKNRLAGH